MFSNRFFQWRQSIVVLVSLSLTAQATAQAGMGVLIELGDPEPVFSMEDFPDITNGHVNWMDVTRDGNKAAFYTHGSYGNPWVYIYQLDDQVGDPRLVMPTGAGNGALSFSRDDSMLIFSHREESDWDIWQVDSDAAGDATRLLGAFSEPGPQYFPCPVVINGQDRIVYREGWSGIDLWSADMSGGDKRRLTFAGNKSAPQASVEGSKIVYMSQSSGGTASADIFLMDLEEEVEHQITDDGTVTKEGYPILVQSHLGEELIVYERMNPSTDRVEMWATDLEGLSHELLIASSLENIYQFSYAPDDPSSPYGAVYYLSTPGPGETSILWRVAVISEPATVSLDIKPGSCPNPFNRSSHGVLPAALLGTADFDATTIDVSSVRLSRADGVGGEIAPNEGPPGPHSVFEDVATPFEGQPCDCHYFAGDGIVDLSMKFRTDDVVDALELDDLSMGDEVELIITGLLTDGTEFTSAGDCILIVPLGISNLIVTSSVPGAFIEVSPANLCNADDSGFADFQRTYSTGTVVTLTAPEMLNDLVFSGWEVDGTPVPSVSGTTSVTLMEAYTTAEAVYVPGS